MQSDEVFPFMSSKCGNIWNSWLKTGNLSDIMMLLNSNIYTGNMKDTPDFAVKNGENIFFLIYEVKNSTCLVQGAGCLNLQQAFLF